MMRHALAALALLAGSISSPASASACSDSIQRYNEALSAVSYALNRYSRCVSESQGRDDCWTEFRRLKSAQDDFESAVSEIESYCKN